MKNTVIIALSLLILIFSSCKKETEEIAGCTCSNATNYNANATVDDGSCTGLLPSMIYISLDCSNVQQVGYVVSHSTWQTVFDYVNNNPTPCLTVSFTALDGTVLTNEIFGSSQEGNSCD